MAIVTWIVAALWGAAAGQCLVQIVASAIMGGMFMVALPSSPVSKTRNVRGLLSCVATIAIVAAIFYIGASLIGRLVDYSTLNSASIVVAVFFIGNTITRSLQVPGKILVTRLCAWDLAFAEAANVLPRDRRVAFARRIQHDRDLAETERNAGRRRRRSF